jgi:hypothetical protein
MGKLAEIKTKQTDSNIVDFINKVPDEQKRKDSLTIIKLMEKATGEKPKMWGASIIGFGKMRYKSPTTGREVDWFIIGLSPRKANLTIYLGLDVQVHSASLKKLGKYKNGKGCLYINKLADVDIKVLEGMIMETVKRK